MEYACLYTLIALGFIFSAALDIQSNRYRRIKTADRGGYLQSAFWPLEVIKNMLEWLMPSSNMRHSI